jgi:hypothetical protein
LATRTFTVGSLRNPRERSSGNLHNQAGTRSTEIPRDLATRNACA